MPTVAKLVPQIVFVFKKDKSLGFYVVFCQLSATTKRDSYAKPSVDECIISFKKQNGLESQIPAQGTGSLK